ncbi:nuclear transport factor 2 family protein [Marivita sp. XM-24bin2]|uniref:nuclear transport factor 2 family protein n=1 Tax=unclassified Marivita TaxID=2632480 RepID=UPI000D798B42|nr:nuclear transport factor 2 family protein [Marivita sp. XM-24bin2]MCR9107921.1 nuclear transport factor 2 family protein [Paracoccaceae bacterium]PWL33764.1 MAG: nuclear transport factor 2 family protein [Marivita sp. XM-24bin2]
MDSLTQVLKAYCDAWCARDEEDRRALLEEAWAEDGLYQDPSGEARGRDSLVAHIGQVHAQFPGAQIELTTGVDAHHDRIRFAWRMMLPDGSVPVQGIDCGRVGADGRLTEIIGFFGPQPPEA